jgi:hypothetical protein
MVTKRQWEDFLYECDLWGQMWTHVNRVGTAYICWRLQIGEVDDMMDAFRANPAMADVKLAEFLSEPHYGAKGVLSTISTENIEKIIVMIHFIVAEKPNPNEWVN